MQRENCICMWCWVLEIRKHKNQSMIVGIQCVCGKWNQDEAMWLWCEGLLMDWKMVDLVSLIAAAMSNFFMRNKLFACLFLSPLSPTAERVCCMEIVKREVCVPCVWERWRFVDGAKLVVSILEEKLLIKSQFLDAF